MTADPLFIVLLAKYLAKPLSYCLQDDKTGFISHLTTFTAVSPLMYGWRYNSVSKFTPVVLIVLSSEKLLSAICNIFEEAKIL